MTVTPNSLRKLASLNLSAEQMAGVLDILADGLQEEQERKDRQAARKRKSRSMSQDGHVTVTGQSQGHTPTPPLVPPSDRFPDLPLTPPYNPPVTPKKPSREGQKSVILPDWMPIPEWEAFREMRTKIKKPMTPHAERLAIGKLDKFRAKGHDPTAILNQSTFSDYQDLYEPKENKHENSSGSNQPAKSKWVSAAEQYIAKHATQPT